MTNRRKAERRKKKRRTKNSPRLWRVKNIGQHFERLNSCTFPAFYLLSCYLVTAEKNYATDAVWSPQASSHTDRHTTRANNVMNDILLMVCRACHLYTSHIAIQHFADVQRTLRKFNSLRILLMESPLHANQYLDDDAVMIVVFILG